MGKIQFVVIGLLGICLLSAVNAKQVTGNTNTKLSPHYREFYFGRPHGIEYVKFIDGSVECYNKPNDVSGFKPYTGTGNRIAFDAKYTCRSSTAATLRSVVNCIAGQSSKDIAWTDIANNDTTHPPKEGGLLLRASLRIKLDNGEHYYIKRFFLMDGLIEHTNFYIIWYYYVDGMKRCQSTEDIDRCHIVWKCKAYKTLDNPDPDDFIWVFFQQAYSPKELPKSNRVNIYTADESI